MHNPGSNLFSLFSNVLKPMGKLNASVDENILLRFPRNKNAQALVWPEPEL